MPMGTQSNAFLLDINCQSLSAFCAYRQRGSNSLQGDLFPRWLDDSCEVWAAGDSVSPVGVSPWTLAQVTLGFKTECSQRQEDMLPVSPTLGLESSTMVS